MGTRERQTGPEPSAKWDAWEEPQVCTQEVSQETAPYGQLTHETTALPLHGGT